MTLILSLPVAGGLWARLPAKQWTEFPPRSQVVQHAAFQGWVFALLAALIAAVVLAVVWRVVSSTRITSGLSVGRSISANTSTVDRSALNVPLRRTGQTLNAQRLTFNAQVKKFPLWGWAGAGWLLVAWVIAWTRLPALTWMQHHTYVLVWIGYIVTVMALTQQRAGSCLLTCRPQLLACLAFVSAVFWWGFEFLNRGVQNWFYQNVEDFSALEYAVMATLSFTTVLPAILATHDWLTTYPRVTAGLEHWVSIRFHRPRLAGAGFALAGAVGLFFLPVYPNALFPLLWLAPLALLCGLQAAAGEATLFDDLVHGDWSTLVRLSLAALICGFFWEMWNMYSLARWVYDVPYVGRFRLFEMPILGFAGYWPFGWECAVVAMAFGLWQPVPRS